MQLAFALLQREHAGRSLSHWRLAEWQRVHVCTFRACVMVVSMFAEEAVGRKQVDAAAASLWFSNVDA